VLGTFACTSGHDKPKPSQNTLAVCSHVQTNLYFRSRLSLVANSCASRRFATQSMMLSRTLSSSSGRKLAMSSFPSCPRMSIVRTYERAIRSPNVSLRSCQRPVWRLTISGTSPAIASQPVRPKPSCHDSISEILALPISSKSSSRFSSKGRAMRFTFRSAVSSASFLRARSSSPPGSLRR
jgi:hypothetical protein